MKSLYKSISIRTEMKTSKGTSITDSIKAPTVPYSYLLVLTLIPFLFDFQIHPPRLICSSNYTISLYSVYIILTSFFISQSFYFYSKVRDYFSTIGRKSLILFVQVIALSKSCSAQQWAHYSQSFLKLPKFQFLSSSNCFFCSGSFTYFVSQVSRLLLLTCLTGSGMLLGYIFYDDFSTAWFFEVYLFLRAAQLTQPITIKYQLDQSVIKMGNIKFIFLRNQQTLRYLSPNQNESSNQRVFVIFNYKIILSIYYSMDQQNQGIFDILGCQESPPDLIQNIFHLDRPEIQQKQEEKIVSFGINEKKKGRPKLKANNKQGNQKTKRYKEETIDQQKRNKGHWLVEENRKYHWFLEIHSNHFINKQLRRMDKIFKTMSTFIGSREAEQCRSHHQKMQKKYENFYKILQSLRLEFYATCEILRVKQDLQKNGHYEYDQLIHDYEIERESVDRKPEKVEMSEKNNCLAYEEKEIINLHQNILEDDYENNFNKFH